MSKVLDLSNREDYPIVGDLVDGITNTKGERRKRSNKISLDLLIEENSELEQYSAKEEISPDSFYLFCQIGKQHQDIKERTLTSRIKKLRETNPKDVKKFGSYIAVKGSKIGYLVKEEGKFNESLDFYLHQINNIPILEKEEEIELAKKYREGDEEALDKLVKANLRFVVTRAQKYRGMNPELPLIDLIQYGNEGLIMAAKKFDPNQDVKLITYAVWWIDQQIRYHLKKDHTVKIPPQHKFLPQIMSLNDLLPRPDFQEETLERIDILEDPNAESQMQKFIQTDFQEDLKRRLDEALNCLKSREAKVLRGRFGLNDEVPKTLEELGKELVLSKERIRQIEEKAKANLKRICEKKGIEL